MSPTGSPDVPDEVVEAFERDGCVCLRGVFSDEWLEPMRRSAEQALGAPGPTAKVYTASTEPGRFSSELGLWMRDDAFRRYAFESPGAEIAARVLRSRKINFFFDHLLVKEPGTYARTPWHQDQPYWNVAGWQLCSIWMPLDPVEQHVSMELVRGSHRWGAEFQPYNFVDGQPYAGRHHTPVPDIEAERGRYDIVSYALEPGDCIVFHARTLHAAPGNSSPERRRVVATRWAGDDVTYLVRQGKVGYPLSDPGLETGDPMDCAMFPRVLPR
jgi:ectoine hydroxylase-related dioxygenase (phytanoyl-CoA dioxygenase family)